MNEEALARALLPIIRIFILITVGYTILMLTGLRAAATLKTLRDEQRSIWSLRPGIKPIQTVRRDGEFQYRTIGNTLAVMISTSLILTGIGLQEESRAIIAAGYLTMLAIIIAMGWLMVKNILKPMWKIFRNQPPIKDRDSGPITTLPPLHPIIWSFPALVIILEIRFPASWPHSAGLNDTVIWAALGTIALLTLAWAITTIHLGIHTALRRGRKEDQEALGGTTAP